MLPQVEIQMAQGGEELDDACLRRWLRADKWDVSAAEGRLKAHAKWRASVAPSGRIEQVRALGRSPSLRTCVSQHASKPPPATQ